MHENNFRNRVWLPAIRAAAIRQPARVYDLRHTYASNQLAAGISSFELSKIMGCSVLMIERHYGALLDGAASGIAARQAQWELGRRTRKGLGRDWVANLSSGPGAERSVSAICRYFLSAPGRTRTCDPRLRRPSLYPAELRGLVVGDCKGV
jgi:hypothetical protein